MPVTGTLTLPDGSHAAYAVTKVDTSLIGSETIVAVHPDKPDMRVTVHESQSVGAALLGAGAAAGAGAAVALPWLAGTGNL